MVQQSLNLEINSGADQDIKNSFERIAIQLIQNWHLKVNDTLFCFTELEFYFFHENVHKDVSTHQHSRPEGSWRFHSQGLDITFAHSQVSDGGILIRGLASGASYVNGPRRVVMEIFERLGSVEMTEKQFGLIRKETPTCNQIYKTPRHGLSQKQDNKYKDELYRYYTGLDYWHHLSLKEKAAIASQSIPVDIT